jgi:hypothetical protein
LGDAIDAGPGSVQTAAIRRWKMKRIAVALVTLAALGSAAAAPRVLLVGTYRAFVGSTSHQAAVDAARPRD